MEHILKIFSSLAMLPSMLPSLVMLKFTLYTVATTIATTSTAIVVPGLKNCPTSNITLGHSACPLNASCCVHEYYRANGCMFADTEICCSPGPPLEPSTTLPNCLIIGDSVSEQYTPHVAELLKTTCKVQHSPWVGGGSANNAYNGLFHLKNCRWLRTAMRPDLHINWDIIMFNFGLHDLPKADPANPTQLDLYMNQLENITKILLGSGAKHVQYALTTPFQPDALPDCGPYCSPGPVNATGIGELSGPLFSSFLLTPEEKPYPQPKNGGNGRCGPPMCQQGSLGCGVPNATAKARSTDPTAPGCGPPTNAVTKLNARAAIVMEKHNVPTLDLNTLVHSHCGKDYHNCSLCDDETKYMGIRCGYHYSPVGISILASAIATSFKGLLTLDSLPLTQP